MAQASVRATQYRHGALIILGIESIQEIIRSAKGEPQIGWRGRAVLDEKPAEASARMMRARFPKTQGKYTGSIWSVNIE
jgi:hypothetical protein